MRAFLITAVLCAAPDAAWAQLCHIGPLGVDHQPDASEVGDHAGHHGHHHAAPIPHHLEATLAVEGALIEGGSYQGLAPSVSWHHGRFGAFVVVPGYRLARDEMDPVVGLGDVVVQANARVLGGARWQAGAIAAVGLPTGDADDGLGMGHVMAMPGLWAAVTPGRATLLVSATVGKSLGADEHAHHAGHAGPIVNPMNAFELGGTARASLAVAPSLSIHALGLVGVPLDDGVTRAAAGAGARWRRASWSVGTEVQLGVAGDPFTTRAIVSLGRSN